MFYNYEKRNAWCKIQCRLKIINTIVEIHNKRIFAHKLFQI